MSHENDIKRLIAEHNRHLQKLKEQEAKLGLHTPPHILTEIEDREIRIEKLQRELNEQIEGDSNKTSKISDDTEDLFSKAIRFQIEGNLGEALELFNEVKRHNPSYPKIDVMIKAVEHELRNDYVDLFGRVISNRLGGSSYQVEFEKQIRSIAKKLKAQRRDIIEAYLVRDTLLRSDDVFIRSRRPIIAVVGTTYTGKSSLINALYGNKELPHTTALVVKTQFESGLVVYDTPGINGDIELENITRAFLGIKQLSEDENGNNLSPIEKIPIADAHIYQQTINGPISFVNPDQIEKPDLIIFVLDIKAAVKRDDIRFFRDTVSGNPSSVIVVANKIDLVDPTVTQLNLSYVHQYIDRRAIPISAHKGWGFEKLLVAILLALPLECNRILTETVNEEYKELAKRHQIEIDSIITAINTAKLFDKTSEIITDSLQYLSNVYALYDLIRNQYLLSTQQLEKVGLDPDNVQKNLIRMSQESVDRLRIAVTVLAFGRSLRLYFEALTEQMDVEGFDIVYEREFFRASDNLKPFFEKIDTEIEYDEDSLAQEILAQLFRSDFNE